MFNSACFSVFEFVFKTIKAEGASTPSNLLSFDCLINSIDFSTVSIPFTELTLNDFVENSNFETECSIVMIMLLILSLSYLASGYFVLLITAQLRIFPKSQQTMI